MPRMFDMIKGRGNSPEHGYLAQKQRRDAVNSSICGKKDKDHSLLSRKLISAVKKHGVDNREKSKEIYEAAVNAVNNLLKKIRNKEDIDGYPDELHPLLDDIFNQLVLGDSILENIRPREEGEYYLLFHIVDTLILSSVIGLKMGFNKSKLHSLGLAAVLHDIQMDSFRVLSCSCRKLNAAESEMIREHVPRCLETIEGINSISDVVKEAIYMHHERADGSGYPRGLSAQDINPYAKIIGLADTYEAMTNNRPYREGICAHKSMKLIIGSLKGYFDAEVLKAFIDKMSIYPIGSILKLDTKELARVIAVHPDSPLRPVVVVIQNAAGDPVKEASIIDLSKNYNLSIQDSV